ncbi:MAG: sulfotransferase domain-containing protein [Crocosphaera sp.]|nr:sulfotransferase domain-containing protein [Crocosphaera sp.]
MKNTIIRLSTQIKQKIKKQVILALSKKNSNQNLYHCCIQKTGSQWLKSIFSDSLFLKYTGLECYDPANNYLNPKLAEEVETINFSPRQIISPLYINYEKFLALKKPENYKAIFVMRDYRDVVTSDYFSYRYSHSVTKWKFMQERREQLNQMSIDDGLMLLINDVKTHKANQIECLRSWLKAKTDSRVLICKFEDMIGSDSLETFKKIFFHFDIDIPESVLKNLLQKHSFKAKAGGRKQGQGNQKSHYRKGISGDWKNYFKEEHIIRFKEITGELLIELGYEKNSNW